MNITCRSCSVSVDHASPGCAEHARREADEIHRAHVVSGGSADHCPVCAKTAAANRAAQRQGMGAELERLRAENARLTRERDAAVAVVAGLRQEISDAADTLHRLSLAQQRIASAGDRGAWATSGAYARAAQIVAGIGDPAARAATGGAS